jgi:hypothetical protein
MTFTFEEFTVVQRWDLHKETMVGVMLGNSKSFYYRLLLWPMQGRYIVKLYLLVQRLNKMDAM